MFTIARYLPLIGVSLFLAVGFLLRAWIHRLRHGHWGIVLFKKASVGQLVRDAMFLLLIGATVLQGAWLAVSPASFLKISRLQELPASGLILLGGAIMFAGIAFMFIAQLHLGHSWRIGIETGASPGLIVGGLYQLCRNPIFVGMFIMLAGMVVLIPTWLSLAVLVSTIACVHLQVLEEEAYLLNAYGQSYRDYARQVGRFLPCVGRLN